MKPPEQSETGSSGFDGELIRLLPLLQSAGLFSPADWLSGQLVLIPCGRSHPVFRMELHGHARMAVKLFTPSRGGTDGDPQREQAVHALASRLPELAALLPARIGHSGPGWLLAQHWFDGDPAWLDDDLVRGTGNGLDALRALAAAFVPALALVHRSAARLQREAPRLEQWKHLQAPCPWVLRLFDGDGPAELWTYPNIAPLLHQAAARPALVQGLRRARGAWRALTLVHGDLKHDNLLQAADGSFALIDWEMARLGDPAWDLAGLLLRPLLSPQIERFDDTARLAAQTLLDHYCAVVALPSQALGQRLLLFCGAWLLMSLIQSESVSPTQADMRERLLGLAEDCLGSAENWAATLKPATRAHDHAA